MPKKKSKSKKSERRFPIFKVTIAIFVFVCVLIYGLQKYGDLDISKDFLKGLIPKREIKVALYFADPHSEYLVNEQREIKDAFSKKQKIAKTIDELIKGPKGNLIHTIASTTRLNNIQIDSDGIVWLDFNSHLSQDHPGGSLSEIMTVYSIVNTVLLNFKDLSKVGILIEGNEVRTLAGHIDCSKPFVLENDFIK